jgi:hypothetical protein
MAKSFFLLLCCAFLSRSLWAQATKPDTARPQKLQLKKVSLAGTDHPDYFAKKNTAGETADTTRSLVYLGPPKKDSMQLGLPAIKSKQLDFKIQAGQRQPLFGRQ